MQSKYIGLIIVGIGVAAFGCTPKEEAAPEQKAAPAPAPEPAEVAEADPTAEAAQIFEDRCAVCHGMSGKGDGEGSAALDPKPRDLTSPEWQKSVTDDHLEQIIVLGGLAVGKSAAMPPNPDLRDKPAVVKELVAYIRDLAK